MKAIYERELRSPTVKTFTWNLKVKPSVLGGNYVTNNSTKVGLFLTAGSFTELTSVVMGVNAPAQTVLMPSSL